MVVGRVLVALTPTVGAVIPVCLQYSAARALSSSWRAAPLQTLVVWIAEPSDRRRVVAKGRGGGRALGGSLEPCVNGEVHVVLIARTIEEFENPSIGR